MTSWSSSGSLPAKVARKIHREVTAISDHLRGTVINVLDRWPCGDAKYLLVGSESSGTTAVSDLLFMEIAGIRFLNEGAQSWVWEAYQRIYQNQKTIRDYPKLQLFDAIKVPGFAAIIPQFREGFPNCRITYMVRDPRDFVNSAIKTFKAKAIEDLRTIPWVTEDWLGIPNQDPVERLCVRWKEYLRLAVEAEGVEFLRYEDFCADKLGTIRELASAMGLPFNESRVGKLADVQLMHSSVRDYKPKGPGGWKTGLLTKGDIDKIESICRPEMERWDYPFQNA